MAPPNPKNDPASTSFDMAPNVVAFLACMVPVMSGLAFLTMEKKNAFVRFHAMQSLVFGSAALLGYGLLWLLVQTVAAASPEIGLVVLFLWILFIFMCFSLWFVQLITAFTLKEWEMPWFGKPSRRLLARLDARNASPPSPEE